MNQQTDIKPGDLYKSVKYGYIYVILDKRNLNKEQAFNVYDITRGKIQWETVFYLNQPETYRKLT